MGSLTTASRLATRVLALTLVLGLALVAVPRDPATLPERSGADLRPAAAALPSAAYRTFTLNIRFGLSPAKARADMVKAFTLGDVGGLQEMSDAEDRQTLMDLANARDWGWYMPVDGGVTIPIIWDRKRFRLLEGRTVMVHGPQAGSPSRWINVVRLREVSTGKVFGYINTHTIAQASFDAQLTDMKRIPLLRKHLAMLRAEILRLFGSTEHVFAGGDLNVNYLADRRRRNKGLPTDALGDLVSFDMPLTGSRGKTSLLDYGMSVKEDGGLVKTDARIVGGFHSDHDAVVFTYRPVDLLAPGPVFNTAQGSGPDRRRALNRLTRAVQNAEAGSLVRLAVSRLGDAVLEQALLQAHLEGVRVQVVSGAGGAAMGRLAATLGTDPLAPSWVKVCSGSCLGGTGRTETDFLLVDRAGGTTDLTMVASTAPTEDATTRYGVVHRSVDGSVYATYGTVFDRMAADTTAVTTGRVVDLGDHEVQLYPVPAKRWRDPVLAALKKVGCTRARGVRTPDGRTNVRVLARQWSGDRGKVIAQRLAGLKRKGCDVAVLAGSRVLGGIQKELRAGGVPVRKAAVGQHTLVVDGRYAGQGDVQRVWTGGPAWTDAALGSDGATLVVEQRTTGRQHLDQFSRIWG